MLPGRCEPTLSHGALGRARSDAPMHLDPSAPNFTRSSYIKLAVRFCIARGAHHCAAMVDKRLNEGSIEHVESRQHSASKCEVYNRAAPVGAGEQGRRN